MLGKIPFCFFFTTHSSAEDKRLHSESNFESSSAVIDSSLKVKCGLLSGNARAGNRISFQG